MSDFKVNYSTANLHDVKKSLDEALDDPKKIGDNENRATMQKIFPNFFDLNAEESSYTSNFQEREAPIESFYNLKNVEELSHLIRSDM